MCDIWICFVIGNLICDCFDQNALLSSVPTAELYYFFKSMFFLPKFLVSRSSSSDFDICIIPVLKENYFYCIFLIYYQL